MFFYRLLMLLAAFPVGLSFLFVIYSVYYAVKQKVNGHPFTFAKWIEWISIELSGFGGYLKTVLVISLIAVFVTSPAVHQLVGVHNLELKPEGNYCFYVEATRNGDKTYTLPAEISVRTEYEEDIDGKSKSKHVYHIEKVFFSNGGWLDTTDSEPVDIGASISFFDESENWLEGDYWKFVLLNEHAYSPYVNETNNAAFWDITIVLLEALCVGFLLYVRCKTEACK